MECSNCTTINLETANYCFQCGNKLSPYCTVDINNVLLQEWKVLEGKLLELTRLNNLSQNSLNMVKDQKNLLKIHESQINLKQVIIDTLNVEIDNCNIVIDEKARAIDKQISRINITESEINDQDKQLDIQYQELSELNRLIVEKEEELLQQNEELIAREEELIAQNEELIVNRDHQRVLIKRLEASNLALEELNRHKTKFLTNMSHELRTPLNAILGFTQLLDKQYYGKLNEKQLEYIVLISHSGVHLLNLVNDLLDISKIDSGTMCLDLGCFCPEECIRSVINVYKCQFAEKCVDLEYCNQSTIKKIRADERKCKQILLNLLSNALKFTPENGKVKVESKLINNNLVIYVIDNGVGVEKEAKDLIFNDFYQCFHDTQISLSGVGIGLPLSKRLVELHKGEINFESQPGKGSKFWFSIPVEQTIS